MSDCPNIEIRELLPEFMHGMLDPRAHQRVQSHLDVCADCSAELALLQAVKAAGEIQLPTPAIDVSQVASAIPPYQPKVRILQQPLRLAAGFLIAAIGISAIAITRQSADSDILPSRSGVATITQTNTIDTPHSLEPSSSMSPGITLVSVTALSDEQLEELIDEVPNLDPLPASLDESELLDFDPLFDVSFSTLGEI
jgi:hypothetical protein